MNSIEIKSLNGLTESIVDGLIEVVDAECERVLISYDKLLEFVDLIEKNNFIIFTGNTYIDNDGYLEQYLEGFWAVPLDIIDDLNEESLSYKSCEYSKKIINKILLIKANEKLYCDLSFMDLDTFKAIK